MPAPTMHTIASAILRELTENPIENAGTDVQITQKPRFIAKQLDAAEVLIVPRGSEEVRVTRSSGESLITIDVGIGQNLTEAADEQTAVEQLSAAAQAVVERFRVTPLQISDGQGGLTPINSTWRNGSVDLEQMADVYEETGVFVAVARLVMTAR